jgi:hypothetical protein
MNDFVFEYRHSGKGLLDPPMLITIIVADLLFAAFLVLFFIVSESYLPFVIVTGIITLTLAPYVILIRKFYYFALTESNKLIMKSAVSFIYRSYTVDLAQIGRIFSENPVKPQAYIFEDTEGNKKAMFNHQMMGTQNFYRYLELIKQRNPHIHIDTTTVLADV